MRRAVLVLLSLAGLLVGTGCAGEPQAEADRPVFRARVLDQPVPRPSFTLTDTAGRPYDFAERTAGQVTLLFYGFTHCPDICPTQLADVATALHRLPPEQAERVHVVFVTNDPDRDTGPVIRRWLDAFDPTFVGLTGSTEQVLASTEAAGLPPPVKGPVQADGDYEVEHAAAVLAFGSDDAARVAYPTTARAEDYLHDLPLLLAGRQPASPSGQDLRASQRITGVQATVGDITVLGARLPEPMDDGPAQLSLTVAAGEVGDELVAASSDAGPVRREADGQSDPSLGWRVDKRDVLVVDAGQGHRLLLPTPTRRLRDGDTVRITLRFARAGEVTLDVPVVAGRRG